jgi:hypothetical protein
MPKTINPRIKINRYQKTLSILALRKKTRSPTIPAVQMFNSVMGGMYASVAAGAQSRQVGRLSSVTCASFSFGRNPCGLDLRGMFRETARTGALPFGVLTSAGTFSPAMRGSCN